MSEKPQLKLVQGGHASKDIDWVDLLENMDLKDALPQLKQLSRQRKVAANSVLAVVEPALSATADTAPDLIGNPESA